MSFDLQHARQVAIHAARGAGELLRSRVDSIHEVRHKGAFDIVTDVDVQSERQVIDALRAEFPTHVIVGEEGGERVGSDARFRWVIDPLDGTTNYAHGFPFFCVSIGLEIDRDLALGVAYSPCLDELFVAEAGGGATVNERPIQVSATAELRQAMLATGFPYDRALFGRAMRSFEVMSREAQAVRRAGSAVLDLCYVACGRFDAYWEHQVKPWDVAAGALIVREAGGCVTNPDGSDFSVDGGQVLASNGRLHASLTAALRAL